MLFKQINLQKSVLLFITYKMFVQHELAIGIPHKILFEQNIFTKLYNFISFLYFMLHELFIITYVRCYT